jgi:hypothetical protein
LGKEVTFTNIRRGFWRWMIWWALFLLFPRFDDDNLRILAVADQAEHNASTPVPNLEPTALGVKFGTMEGFMETGEAIFILNDKASPLSWNKVIPVFTLYKTFAVPNSCRAAAEYECIVSPCRNFKPVDFSSNAVKEVVSQVMTPYGVSSVGRYRVDWGQDVGLNDNWTTSAIGCGTLEEYARGIHPVAHLRRVSEHSLMLIS